MNDALTQRENQHDFTTNEETNKIPQFNLTVHSRTINDLKFNKDADLLFTASKDFTSCLIRTDGTILGTYEGHQGSILSIDPSHDSSLLITGGADKKIMLWDIFTGQCIDKIELESITRSISFLNNEESNKILFATDDSFFKKPIFGVIDKRTMKIVQEFDIDSVPTKGISNYSSNIAVYSDTEGSIKSIDIRTGQILLSKSTHTSRINNLKNSFCNSFFMTASSDAKAKIFDYKLKEMKCFTSEDPVNSCAIFTTNDKVLTAGGINARDVTVTRSKTNFMVNAFDIVTGKLVGTYSTHFGTINAIDVSPDGSMYASGAEDGIICVVSFDENFYNDEGFTNIKDYDK